MAAQVHSVLRTVSYRVVHEFLYATSLPHQSKVRVRAQSAGIDADEVIHRLFRLPILSLVFHDCSCAKVGEHGRTGLTGARPAVDEKHGHARDVDIGFRCDKALRPDRERSPNLTVRVTDDMQFAADVPSMPVVLQRDAVNLTYDICHFLDRQGDNVRPGSQGRVFGPSRGFRIRVVHQVNVVVDFVGTVHRHDRMVRYGAFPVQRLVALMADQVAGLENRGITNVVAINGLLSMPERKEALDRVRLGDAAIVPISPEQLRSRPTRTALEQRLIGAWGLDEAHCLSKWGHDFRPDYRYIGKFIHRHSGGGRLAPVLCLTATAKPEVKEEIREYFQQTNSVELEILDGGARRANLDFDVIKTEAGTKMGLLKDLVESHTDDGDGRAIIYCSTRSQAENVAEFLSANGLETRFFHAAMTPDRKMEVQNAFISCKSPRTMYQ